MLTTKNLALFDKQLLLHFDPQRERWVVLRMPEKYGQPRGAYDHSEIRRRIAAGNLIEIFVCQDTEGRPMEPGTWTLNYLQERDTRRISLRQYVWELDERNRKYSTKLEQERLDRLNYRMREDWAHIQDELRGDTTFRKYTIPVEKPNVEPTNPS